MTFTSRRECGAQESVDNDAYDGDADADAGETVMLLLIDMINKCMLVVLVMVLVLVLVLVTPSPFLMLLRRDRRHHRRYSRWNGMEHTVLTIHSHSHTVQ